MSMTYRKIRDILNNLTDDENLDAPARVIEVERPTEGELAFILGADFPIEDIGIDDDGKPYFEMPFLPDPESRSQDGQAVS